MKHIRYYIMALLALPLMASCGDDDYSAPTPAGNPVRAIRLLLQLYGWAMKWR